MSWVRSQDRRGRGDCRHREVVGARFTPVVLNHFILAFAGVAFDLTRFSGFLERAFPVEGRSVERTQ